MPAREHGVDHFSPWRPVRQNHHQLPPINVVMHQGHRHLCNADAVHRSASQHRQSLGDELRTVLNREFHAILMKQRPAVITLRTAVMDAGEA